MDKIGHKTFFMLYKVEKRQRIPEIVVLLQLEYSKYLRKCNWKTFGFYQIKYLGILKILLNIRESETMLDLNVYSASNDLK